MINAASYNQWELVTKNSIDEVSEDHNIWVDLVDPDIHEILFVAKKFFLANECVQWYFDTFLRPPRLLDTLRFESIRTSIHSTTKIYIWS